MPKENRITIQFNTSDEEQKKCLMFLDKCGYKKNKIVAIMASEFISRYGLDLDILDAEEIKKFLTGYEYIKIHTKEQPSEDTVQRSDEKEEKLVENHTPSEPVRNTVMPNKEVRNINMPTPPQQPASSAKSGSVAIDNEKADRALSAFGL